MAIEEITIATPPSRLFQGISTNYLDNMTYAEFLLGILKKMNEIIAVSNTQQEFIDEFNVKYQQLLKQFEQLRSEFDALEDKITASVQAQLDAFEVEVRNLITATQNYLIAYTDSTEARLQAQIEAIQVGAINVIDPTTGMLSPIQTVINNIAGSSADALTASEYDALTLTATAYDNYDITAYDYDFKGKALLV